MAERVITAGYLSVAANDLTGYMKSIELPVEVETVESTNFDSGGWREYEGGLKNWSISADFNQDYDDNAIDEVLWTIFTASAKVAVEVRPDDAAVSANNPKWTGMGLVTGYPLVAGSVGALSEGTLAIQGSGELNRAIT